jgi:hypothetical protein
MEVSGLAHCPRRNHPDLFFHQLRENEKGAVMSAPYQEVPSTHRRCGKCLKVFLGRAGLADHFRMKHGRDPLVSDFLPVIKPEQADREVSFADRTIQAIIDRDCGVENPDRDWLI